jgi:hypothetical protein
MEDRRAVYQLHTAEGTVLYVGSSRSPEQRIQDHKRKPWGKMIAAHVITWYPDSASALEAERYAIAVLKPPYNGLPSPPTKVDPIAKQIGERIRAVRKEHGKSQLVVAMQSHCSIAEISQYENGQRLPNTRRLLQLAAALGVSVADLVPEPYRSRKVPAEMSEAETRNPPPGVSASP